MRLPHYLYVAIGIAIFGATAWAQRADRAFKPDAVLDLRTTEGITQVKGQWLYSTAKIIEVDHHAVGADLKPSGPPNRTNDIDPQAQTIDFDDCGWESIAPELLENRRGNGRLSFSWYRLRLTLPQRVGNFATAGATVYFEIVVDDYAEVWVDGKLPQVLGESGGAVIAGWNAPNRVLLTRDAKPGQQIQLAIFAANGPLSKPPGNFIWIRSATLDFYKPGRIGAGAGEEVPMTVERLDPDIDAIIPYNVKAERLADGFGFTEGPVWVNEANAQPPHLLFSDPNNNTIYRYSDGKISIFRTHSGYTGADIGTYNQPGSNGLARDPQGRLTICEHGNRRVTRLEPNGVITVLADRFQGKRLNSPNDLVYRSDGALFFTDPPFGLPKFHDDPRRELPHFGVYCLKDRSLKLISTDLTGPNGLAFSPDEKYLYVSNWDATRKIVMRYDVADDGTLARGTVFFDLTSIPGPHALDGLKLDRAGNIFVSGPGRVWIVSHTGKPLGTLKLPEDPANFAWGDEGQSLYLTARTSLYRVRLAW
jgi:gluconolactonase